MGPILEVEGLVKDYPGVRAVDGVSFAVERGRCFALLGPNGAGKTTTLEIIEDILEPTAGRILYKGEPRGRRFKQEVGIQLQTTELLHRLTVRETVETFWRLYGGRTSLAEIMRLCELEEIADRDNRKISGGQRQRVLLALALVNDPELVFLDEPTTGMDPQARRHLWDIVRQIRAKGRTIILTTHYMEEAEVLSDEVAIMDRGRIIVKGRTQDLLREHCAGVIVSLPSGVPLAKLEGLGFVLDEHEQRFQATVMDPDACLRTLLDRGVDLSEVTVRHRNLEDLFLAITGRSLRE